MIRERFWRRVSARFANCPSPRLLPGPRTRLLLLFRSCVSTISKVFIWLFITLLSHRRCLGVWLGGSGKACRIRIPACIVRWFVPLSNHHDWPMGRYCQLARATVHSTECVCDRTIQWLQVNTKCQEQSTIWIYITEKPTTVQTY